MAQRSQKSISIDECYEILGVNKDSTEDDIRRAYKRQALQTHPDKNPDDPDASTKFRKVSEAYQRLTAHDDDDNDYDDDDDDDDGHHYYHEGFSFDFGEDDEENEEFEFVHRFKARGHMNFFEHLLFEEILRSQRSGRGFPFGGGRSAPSFPFGFRPSSRGDEYNEEREYDDEYYDGDIPIFRFSDKVDIKKDLYPGERSKKKTAAQKAKEKKEKQKEKKKQKEKQKKKQEGEGEDEEVIKTGNHSAEKIPDIAKKENLGISEPKKSNRNLNKVNHGTDDSEEDVDDDVFCRIGRKMKA